MQLVTAREGTQFQKKGSVSGVTILSQQPCPQKSLHVELLC